MALRTNVGSNRRRMSAADTLTDASAQARHRQGAGGVRRALSFSSSARTARTESSSTASLYNICERAEEQG